MSNKNTREGKGAPSSFVTDGRGVKKGPKKTTAQKTVCLFLYVLLNYSGDTFIKVMQIVRVWDLCLDYAYA
jgi:hypothetical protein